MPTVVIVSFNASDYLRRNLEKLSAIKNLEIIVVDNASTDPKIAELPKLFPTVRWMQNADNLGFSKANNMGWKLAKSEWILFLNPDCEIEESAIKTMVNFAKQNKSLGILGPKIVSADGKFEPASRRKIPSLWSGFLRVSGLDLKQGNGGYHYREFSENETHKIQAVSGSCLLISRKNLEKLDGWDEDFFLYGEDLDLCFRSEKAGLENFYCADAIVIHHKGKSAETNPKRAKVEFYHSMAIFAKKHFSLPKRLSVWVGAQLALLLANYDKK